LRPQLLQAPIVDNSTPNSAFNNGGPICFAGQISGSCGLAVAMNLDPTTGLMTPGNLGRNTFVGPALKNLDVSFLKNFRIGGGEGKTLQFRAEFFNAFDTSNFLQPYSQAGLASNLPVTCTMPTTTTPGCTLGTVPVANAAIYSDPFFGKILQARPAFQAQFAAKLIF
jgi:hypothetical protein